MVLPSSPPVLTPAGWDTWANNVTDSIVAHDGKIGGRAPIANSLATSFLHADHVLTTLIAGTFTPTHDTHSVSVSLSGQAQGAAHIGVWLVWNDDVSAGSDLLTGDDFNSDPFVTGSSFKTIGACASSGNVMGLSREVVLTGLTPGLETTYEVVVASIGYFESEVIGDFPNDLAIDADHQHVYVAAFSSNKIEVFKTVWRQSTDRKIEKVTEWTGHTGVYGLAAHPTDANIIYASRFTTDEVVEINASTGVVSDTWTITDPYYLAVEPDGSHLWVVRQGSNQVQPIAIGGAVGTAVTVGAGPYKPDVDDSYLYVPCATGNRIDRIAFSNSAVTTLNLGASTAPVALSVSPDKQTMWVLEQTAQRAREVDLTTFSLTGESITGIGGSGSDIQISPSGKSLVIVRGATTTSMQTYVLPASGTLYESADVQEINRMILGHDGSIYAVANGDDTLYAWHCAYIDIDPTDNFWCGYADVLIR